MEKSDYKTKQKEQIKDFFKNNPNKFYTVKEIEKNINVGLTTIYRFLDGFVLENEVSVYIADKTKKYGYFDCGCENHYHLICSECGTVIHIECESFTNVAKHILTDHKFYLDITNNFLKGRCELCYLEN